VLLRLQKAVVLGATGPTGKFLARELLARGLAVRVVARSPGRLAEAFGALGVEQVAADLRDAEAVAGRTVSWIGSPATARESVHVPDTMKTVVDLAWRPQAYGEHWIVPGAGPLSLERVLAIAEPHLGRSLRARGAGPFTLPLVSLFVRPLRSFLPMVPLYLKPLAFDGRKVRGLLGELPITPYEVAIPQTLDWLARQARSPREAG
jgi:nucleoside-diphosphate-sugar epimerase